MHVSSSLFIAEAVWLPRLWLTVSCFPSCSITSPLTPTCGSSALWQGGLPCGGGKPKHSWLVEQERHAVCLSVPEKDGSSWRVGCRRDLAPTVVFLLNSLSCSAPPSPPPPAPTAGQIKMQHQFIIPAILLSLPSTPPKHNSYNCSFSANINISSHK